MGIIRISALFMLLLVLIGGCNGTAREGSFEAWDEGFECEICWKDASGRYRAKLLAKEMKEGKRELTMNFLEPDTLSGVSAELVDGEIKLSLGDMEAENVKSFGMFDVAELFEGGKIISKDSVSLAGERSELLKIEAEDGEEREIYLAENKEPRKIHGRVNGRNIEMEVIWFEKRGS